MRSASWCLTKPMPSMPVSFWNDPDGSRLRDAYFADFPGAWRHGDWVRKTPRGSFVIYGRSDSTLNRGGVRMGTADFYAVVEGLEEIVDSLVVDTTELGAADEGELLCFVVLAPVPRWPRLSHGCGRPSAPICRRGTCRTVPRRRCDPARSTARSARYR